jgi:hypothetical protein
MRHSSNTLSRRDFLKLGLLSLASLAADRLPARREPPEPEVYGRVTVSVVNVYSQPNFEAQRTGKRTRDQLLSLLEEVTSPAGPAHNPLWYRIPGGYVYSARIQRVVPRPANQPIDRIPESGALGEICIPFTRAYRYTSGAGWQKLYRLYDSTVHWITGLDQGPDGRPWYRLKDHLLDVEYHAPAAHLRPVLPDEYSPLSPDVPPEEKRIDVSIERQTLSASEGGRVVFTAPVSSGLHSERLQKGELPTDTPLGSFRIQMKMPSRHMGDGKLTPEIEAYELPGVPWTCVFHETGVAFHGTYWHNNFGIRMSHGCVNLRNADALWLFRWTTPAFAPVDYYTKGVGTLVVVRP